MPTSLIHLVRLVLPVALLLGAASSATANAVFCNEDEDSEVALAGVYLNSATGLWEGSGWLVVPSGQCRRLLTTQLRQLVYISVTGRESGSEGPWMIRLFPVERIGSPDHRERGWRAVERFFCVKEGEFFRETRSLEEHMNCPDGYHPQLFNLLGSSNANTDLRFTLR